MSVREYIGARYVPLFADPIVWNNARTYEPLTIVTYEGNSYTSRQYVPEGIAITNEDYWALTGNYNAQVEQYRRESQAVAAQVDAIERTAKDAEASAAGAVAAVQALNTELSAEITNRTNADTQIREDVAADIAEEVASLNATIAADVNRLETQDESLSNRITALEGGKEKQLIFIGDSWLNGVNNRQLHNIIRDKFGIKSAKTFNFASGGSGFLRATDVNFATQLSNAVADSNIDKSAPTYIVVMGGTNDYAAGFHTASQYVNVIDAMQETINSEFVNAHAVFFFMQGAKDRTYPYALIRDVVTNSKAAVVNLAWAIPFSNFLDALHLTADGEKQCADFVLSAFGLGNYGSQSAGVNLTAKANNALGNYFSTFEVRQVWDAHSVTTTIVAWVENAIGANGLNGFIENIQLPAPVFAASYPFTSKGVMLTIGQGWKINIDVTSNRIGFRSFDAVNAKTAITGSATEVIS